MNKAAEQRAADTRARSTNWRLDEVIRLLKRLLAKKRKKK